MEEKKPSVVDKLVELSFMAKSMENEFKEIEEEILKSTKKLNIKTEPYRLTWADIERMQESKNYHIAGSFTSTEGNYIRYKIDEEGNPILCTVEEFDKWLSTKPNLTLFENKIKGYRVVTMFHPDNFDSNWNQVVAYATELYLITKPDEEEIIYKWASFPNLKEAEERHKRAIMVVLDEIKKSKKVGNEDD